MLQAAPIFWLALEGLCRQDGAPPWELLISAEQEPHHGNPPLQAITAYWPRLQLAGCVHLGIMDPGPCPADPAPLSLKWRQLASAAHPASEAFLLQAADCFSAPERLADSHHLLQRAHWVHQREGLFLHLPTGTLVQYRHPDGFPTALNMGTRTQLLRHLPRHEVRKGVDRWMHDHVRMQVGTVRTAWLPTAHALGSLDTHGANNISRRRGTKMMALLPPFYSTPLWLQDVLPPDLVERLHATAKALHA